MGIKIIYLTGEGLFREGKGKIETEFPGSIRNKKEPQQHSLVPNPVFPETMTHFPVKDNNGVEQRRYFKTWDEFINFPTPQVVRESDKSLMVAFDNDSYPLGPNDITKEDEEVRQNARQASFQEAIHRGRFVAEQMDRGLQMVMVITLAAVGGFATLIVGLLFLLGKVGK